MFWDNPPHVIDTYTVASGVDPGGGNALVYTLAQTGAPCIINSSSASEREMYAQMAIVVTHRVSFKTDTLTTPLSRGMKLVSGTSSFHVKGINGGQAIGNIPPLIYADCEEQL